MTRRPPPNDPRREAALAAWEQVTAHPLFRAIGGILVEADEDEVGLDRWARVSPRGWLRFSSRRQADEQEWVWMFAHALLHLGFGHSDPRQAGPDAVGARTKLPEGPAWAPEPAYRVACCHAVDDFLATLRIGRRPASGRSPDGRPQAVPDGPPDFLIGDAATAERMDFPRAFAVGVTDAATQALGRIAAATDGTGTRKGPWDAALSWFVSSYPLLGAVAAGMTLVADADLARDWDIAVAAISAEAAEIYINPLARMSEGEWRFVLAHEMLHAALRHAERVGGRDAFLWNVACDYVVNGWLIEMGVGEPLEGALHDPELSGLSCEAVYDRITVELRRARKLATLRGRGLGDMLDRPIARPGSPGRYTDLDDFYRHALSTALSYHDNSGRGLLPEGLVEEIRALDHPPLPWDARLARWFDEHVPTTEKRRTYARLSRRQAATPDIPRPGWARRDEVVGHMTFGVVLDTSGSMDTKILGTALGAIASYAVSRDVTQVRVVFCDAVAYDAGYMHVADIASRVRVRGRGGTVIQSGIDLLEIAGDFPPHGPLLVITDGRCDAFRTRREHAILLPAGANLPFRARGQIFRME